MYLSDSSAVLAIWQAAESKPASGDVQLTTAAVLGFAVVILLIAVAKVHPFLSLVFGALVLGVVANLGPEDTIASFSTGVGTTVGGVGLLIAVGAMIGGLLAESGGADRIVATVVDNVSAHRLPWAMAGVAALIGLPLFFEVGVVLLIPVVLLVSRRTTVPLLKIAIPALAGLSVLHGLVPPHPGPLAAIGALNADLGLTLLFGLIIAIPTVIIAGPVFGNFISQYVTARAPDSLIPTREPATVGVGGGTASGSPGIPPDAAAASADDADETEVDSAGRAGGAGGSVTAVAGARRSPAFWPSVLTILLPIVLMLLRAIGELTMDEGNGVRSALEVIGAPLVALLAGLVVAMFTLGFAAGFSREEVSGTVGGALPAIAGILLIVAAGGGFKQVLIDAGVGQMIADAANGANLSPLILGWLVAVGIRVATGSATVATITAAGIVAPLAADLSSPTVALLVLAIGSGSLFFSHVNDAGFWLVKEYLGLTVGQTIKTWSVMETIISVCGLIGVLLLSIIV
ncbi:MAG TPA: SLC13 family permease [Kineosporiaceae bacterium]|nr:SLC13 family permease [Kineosporiaceae bacterium]